MKMRMKEQKNFYSNVDWNQWHEYALVNFPKDPEGEGWEELLDMCADYDLWQIERNEEKYNRKYFRTSLVTKVIKFLLSWIPKDEFNGAYKK